MGSHVANFSALYILDFVLMVVIDRKMFMQIKSS